MNTGRTQQPREQAPRWLIVEDDPELGRELLRWMQQQNMCVVLATSAQEATNLMQDAAFIESDFHGLLVDSVLPDGSGCRVARDFRHEFPNAPVGLMMDEESISTELWSRARGIPLFRKPLRLNEVQNWLDEQVSIPA